MYVIMDVLTSHTSQLPLLLILNKYNKQLSFSKFLLLVIMTIYVTFTFSAFYFVHVRILYTPYYCVRSLPKYNYIVLGTKIEVDGPSGARGVYYGELFIILT